MPLSGQLDVYCQLYDVVSPNVGGIVANHDIISDDCGEVQMVASQTAQVR